MIPCLYWEAAILLWEDQLPRVFLDAHFCETIDRSTCILDLEESCFDVETPSTVAKRMEKYK